MTEMDIRNQLYEKLEQEFKEYIDDMKNNEPEVIVNSAYEIVFKEEIITMFYPESERFDIEEIKALNKTKEPLNEMYEAWMDSDVGINSILEDSIEDRLDELVKEQKEKKKDKER